MEQLLCHLAGDYLFQNHWMATNKTKSWKAAGVHATVYTLFFLLITTNFYSLFIIWSSHIIIDRLSLVKRFWSYQGPEYLSVWLSIIADNTVHLIINYLALTI